MNPRVTELFIRGRKLSISLVFITQSYFDLPKKISLNSTHYFIAKMPSKWELQHIALNTSSDIDSKDFMDLLKKCTMIALEWYLMINTNQFMEKGSKY